MAAAPYRLSVFYALPCADTSAPDRPAIVVHVYGVDVAQPLQWVREHADELAARIGNGRPYCALMVERQAAELEA
jgi:hypothetical protein